MAYQQFMFGAGSMYGVPLQDASGAAVANPTPVKFGTLQDISLDLSFDTKLLYGQNQFPEAIGRGKGKVSAKSKFAQLNGALLNSLYFGQTLSTGLTAVYLDSTGTAIPGTPYQITVTPPNSGVFAKDLGVKKADGTPMKRVASAPATGQYSVNEASGIYTFAAADTTLIMYIDYKYTIAASGSTISVANVSMGYVPTFRAELYLPYQGKSMCFTLPNCVATKLSFATKLDDFMLPDFDFEGFADASGQVITISTSS